VNNIKVKAGFSGRDELELEADAEGGLIRSAKLRGIGCPQVLNLISEWRNRLKGAVAEVPEPSGTDHASILLRELIQKLKGTWEFPYKELELCHCRMIPCAVVDAAIVYGADSANKVAVKTSAGTGCGTCRRNTEAIIKFRRG
jgi:bacterioferritin-associated ferredoxin